ncbi:hypothetical protein FRAAL5565 [Frankia alni ACN14a]|uniref:Uncharacterized protein n=1 Tax=Frankia alni (strain DSM 45986 / CECT 9034 / ACN14a) TaxID=326424 RepID=Q0REB2_FRAAA|nr:hypothetical protein FRAAL5565 [Frankia alni ACN14a]
MCGGLGGAAVEERCLAFDSLARGGSGPVGLERGSIGGGLTRVGSGRPGTPAELVGRARVVELGHRSVPLSASGPVWRPVAARGTDRFLPAVALANAPTADDIVRSATAR